VKFSRTRSVALSASSSLSFSATAPLYQLAAARPAAATIQSGVEERRSGCFR
jgi:hypothetical protein